MAADTQKVYGKIWLTDFFHAFPHINFHFKSVNSTFNPESNDYLQSLGFLFAVPVAICLILWLVYLTFFACRSCQKPNSRPRQKSQSSCVIGFLFVLVIVGICILGLGFYNNERAHSGVDGVGGAAVNMNTTINAARIGITNLDDISDKVVNVWAGSLEDSVQSIPDSEIKRELLTMIEQMAQQAAEAKTTLVAVDKLDASQDYLTDFHDVVENVEYYRWIGTIAVLTIYSVLYVSILVGQIKHWRTLLIVNAVFAVFLTLLFWAVLGTYLGSSVGLGDFCKNPDAYFVKKLTKAEMSDKLLVYMQCPDPSKPYQEIIAKAQADIVQASSLLETISQHVKPFHLKRFEATAKVVQDNLQMALANLSTIQSNVGTCTTLHNYYVDGINSACVHSIKSFAVLLIVTASLALITAILVFIISCVWRQYRKETSVEYLREDDTDPFLPRPPPYDRDYGTISRAGPRAWSERSSRASPRAWSERGGLRAQHPSVNEETVMILRHPHPTAPREDSPPPAYHSGQFSTHHLEAALSSNYGQPRNQ
ncbi:protein tweety homolog [Plakobranchus ocellatus]|uniref:Protein tweety homolog n=1 Tax=Plakobranchus ocellatus TaxID=259542 RepID=A0AAV3YVM3_9GAST|nr:protein tweety homolog [Plakobranchus ocellatus]